MSNCDQNCEAVANLNDYAANLIDYSKRIDKWVNGGQTEFVDVGGVQTPTLRNLAMSIKALMGVHPDNKTIFINQDKEIYVKLSALIQSGGGLNIDSNGKLYVDVSSMNTEVFESLLQTLRLPLWLDADMTFYVNFATGSDTLDDGRGLSASKPFKTIQACIDYVTTNYNINVYKATIYVANGTYPAFNAKPYQRTSGYIEVIGQSKNGVIIKNNSNTGSPSTTTATVSGSFWNFQNITFETSTADGLSSERQLFTLNIQGQSRALLTNCAVKMIQTQTWPSLVNLPAIAVLNSSIISLYEGCSINSQVSSGSSKVIGLSANSYGVVQLSWETPQGSQLSINGSFLYTAFTTGHGSITRIQKVLSGISGTATGIRYTCYDGGSINTAGGGPNFFPGSEPGVVQQSSYSYYI